MWDTARRTLGRIAELGEREGVTFVLENLNTAVDHPRHALRPGGRHPRPGARRRLARTCGSTSTSTTRRSARGTSSSSAARRCPGSPRCRSPTCPGRCEPGTGEIRYAGVARALADAGFTGVVGLEAFASADPDAALAAFREAFTP